MAGHWAAWQDHRHVDDQERGRRHNRGSTRLRSACVVVSALSRAIYRQHPHDQLKRGEHDPAASVYWARRAAVTFAGAHDDIIVCRARRQEERSASSSGAAYEVGVLPSHRRVATPRTAELSSSRTATYSCSTATHFTRGGGAPAAPRACSSGSPQPLRATSKAAPGRAGCDAGCNPRSRDRRRVSSWYRAEQQLVAIVNPLSGYRAPQ